ncbi:SHOCT domain-containing protein [Halorubellus sp. JP-L1]|uniref:SHOCT domain-containing protein n=1 Tax=Halorubellus sp. JP-L1 TaxID=2715753 RepID=UPI00140809A2|nr:SHOCT domain-containing protein [Halorubellus sp. JP-L1]NHN40607.1 SHOCT domain-containing protein [Halorubellus sp. JP-L1]
MSEHGNEAVDDDGEDLLETLPAIIAVATLGIGATTAILGLGEVTAIVFVVGWLLLTPLSAILGETTAVRNFVSGATSGRATRSSTESERERGEDAALEELKGRYARGELDEAEFERRTATLLENESIEDVRSRVERTADAGSHDGPTEREHAADRDGEREPEYET